MTSYRFAECLTSVILFISSGEGIVQSNSFAKVFGSVCVIELFRIDVTECVTEITIAKPISYDISTLCMRIS